MPNEQIFHDGPVQQQKTVDLGPKPLDAELRRDIARATLTIVELHEQLEAARIDAVTGLPNRAVFDQDFARLFSRTDKYIGQLGLAIIDLNYLKTVNDVHGHLLGDKYLRAAAKNISQNVRPLDKVYRIGGDEFAILMPGLDGSDKERQDNKERIRSAVNASLDDNLNVDIEIGLSIGIDCIKEGDSPASFYARVDEQMYQDKAAIKAQE